MEVPKITKNRSSIEKNKINMLCQAFISKYTQKQ